MGACLRRPIYVIEQPVFAQYQLRESQAAHNKAAVDMLLDAEEKGELTPAFVVELSNHLYRGGAQEFFALALCPSVPQANFQRHTRHNFARYCVRQSQA